jgi:tetratricopeptide (TPR) repeat protein
MKDNVFLSPSPHAAAQLADAMTKHAAGDLDAAAQDYRAILAAKPDHPDALHLLGVIAQQKGNPELALKLIEAALAHNASFAAAWANRALVLRVLDRPDEALQSIQLAIESDPALPGSWDLAATLLRQIKNYDAAIIHHQTALQQDPTNGVFKANYAATLLVIGAIHAAYDQLRDLPEPTSNADIVHAVPPVLGNVLQAAGYPARAAVCFHSAAAAVAHIPGIHVNEALARLKIGDYAEGLSLWQTRIDSQDETFKAIPKWDGGKTDHLLLYEDQGMGDALQAVRYLPLLKHHAGRMTLQLTAALGRIIKASFPDIAILTLDDPVPAATARCSLMSLPYHLSTRLNAMPPSAPYLQASDVLRMAWRERLAFLPAPRLGIVWGGNPGYANDKNRSVPFAHLAPVIEAARRHLVSLQLGRPADQAVLDASGIYDAAPFLESFADTAAALAELDLLITVDTAIAHLAGGMGRPVWLMLPFDPDWRWLLNREDSPWYPSIKLYRQTAPGDWRGVTEKLANDIRKYLQGDHTILRPEVWQGPPAQYNRYALDLKDPEKISGPVT